MRKLHQGNGLCYMGRFIDIQRQRFAGLGIAEFTATGTDIATYHKGGGSFTPTFSHVGATATAANRMEAMGFHNAFCFGIALIGTNAYFEPFRLAYSFRHLIKGCF
ncbi:hypothetical protein HMPREF9446_02002 [Bacteroides fluxus YIT 12057]|uniref:Uncharacterized protein n=1 Tax=Bacteroides fluxus YIT 12057 TaxID=763034 RepID=F3PTD3_9BACE|nr:hypothetical protein HMPREF9446_02002 [Bacteroides fluxus YIT 12057]